MKRLPPSSTRSDTLFPSPTFFRSLVELPQDALVDGSGFMRQGFKSWTTHRDRTVCIRKLVGFGPGLAARILASFNMAADTPFLRPDTHTPRPAEGDRKSTRLNSSH